MLQDGPRKLNLASLGALLGSFWTQLGPTWPQLGPILAPTWPNLARLGRSWRQLGSILALQVAPAGAQDPQKPPKSEREPAREAPKTAQDHPKDPISGEIGLIVRVPWALLDLSACSLPAGLGGCAKR